MAGRTCWRSIGNGFVQKLGGAKKSLGLDENTVNYIDRIVDEYLRHDQELQTDQTKGRDRNE